MHKLFTFDGDAIISQRTPINLNNNGDEQIVLARNDPKLRRLSKYENQKILWAVASVL